MVIKSSEDVVKLMFERFDEIASMDKTDIGSKRKEWVIGLFFDLYRFIYEAEHSRDDYRTAKTSMAKFVAKSNFEETLQVTNTITEQIDWELKLFSKVAE